MSTDKTELPSWETSSEKLELDCKIFQVYKRKARHPVRDVEAEFSIVRGSDWIQAISLTPDNKLVMVNQYRFGWDTFSWEMPGGLLDEGEDPVVGAVRELREETGYIGKNPIKIGECSPNPAIQSNKAHFILLSDCVLSCEQEWDAHEEIEIGVFSMDEVLEMAKDGRVHNSIAYNALFFLERHLENCKLSEG